MILKSLFLALILGMNLAMAVDPQTTAPTGPFNTFHQIGVDYQTSAAIHGSPISVVPGSVRSEDFQPRERVYSAWRSPDGFPCNGPSECLSNFCMSQGLNGKVCGTPDMYCRSQGGRCMNDCDCCSNICSSASTCVSDGKAECTPNGSRYNRTPDECCSKEGSASTMKCIPSPYSCQGLDAPCSKDTQCCSKTCGSYGQCIPRSFGTDFILFQEDGP